jgi:predicted Rossmann fold flavoprotein
MKPSSFYDVIVIGAGASGLMCAMTAAQRGKRVLVIEKANKVGKKILMSGGGRCNFTNHYVEAENYISKNPHFVKSPLKQYNQWDFISLVERYDIEYEERSHSQLFCLHSAKDILNMLLKECDSAGVAVITETDVIEVVNVHQAQANSPDFEDVRIRYQTICNENGRKRALNCNSLVVASGALSIPSLGGSGYGYELAKQFQLPLVARQAGLVPFMFTDSTKSMCERLSGLALEVDVICNGMVFTENILFTHRGVSGPVILQISNYWSPGDDVQVNLIPSLDISAWLLQTKVSHSKSLLRTLLAKKLSKNLVSELQQLFWSKEADRPLAEISDKRLQEIGGKLNAWALKPSGTEGYRTAEVTLGGVDTDSINSKTMEVKAQAGLFFIGEVLDVTGHLGGYNFQWAWSSGYTAGLNV